MISGIIIALLIRGVFLQAGRHPPTALYVLITTSAAFQTIFVEFVVKSVS